jgi:hypothetical protein
MGMSARTLVTIEAVARSLNDARRATARELDQQVDELTAGDLIVDDHPHWAKVADGQALRGIPALSPFGAGSAITGSQPGVGPLFDEDE